MAIQRYDPNINCAGKMSEMVNGVYVSYTRHILELAALKADHEADKQALLAKLREEHEAEKRKMLAEIIDPPLALEFEGNKYLVESHIKDVFAKHGIVTKEGKV